MTGFGESRSQSDTLTVAVEVRAVNNRHLKVTVRGTDPYPLLDADVEKVVRRHVRRGSLLIQIVVDRLDRTPDLVVNTTALKTYLHQIRTACDEVGRADYATGILSGVLQLPGVIVGLARSVSPPADEWPVVERVLEDAVHQLNGMRRAEGAAMAAEFRAQHAVIHSELEAVRRHLPAVMIDYRRRLFDRVRQALAEVSLQPDQLVREIALFADRTDVSEEVTRLASHLEQYLEVVEQGGEGAGRKLEFVIQEMGRETNTLGSKAGDVIISRHAIEMKTALERARELVQNIE